MRTAVIRMHREDMVRLYVDRICNDPYVEER